MARSDDYPKSDGFISEMTAESVYQIIEAGWLIEKTLFFEIPYCAVTGVGAGIARDYHHQVYYKIFYATEGVIQSLTNLQLRVVVEHEQDEVNQRSSNAFEDLLEAAPPSDAEEIERHKIEMRPIEERYGKDVVDGTIQQVFETSSTKALIPRFVLLFWIWSYLLKRSEHFVQQAMPMSPGMLSKKQRSVFINELNRVMKEYSSSSYAPSEEWVELYSSAIAIQK
jgi:hypothetical protein